MKKFLSVLFLLAILTLTLVSCGTKVIWYDADGTLLYSEKLAKDATALPEKPLPEDNGEWDYTEWKEISADEKEIILEAQRVAIDRYVWKDADGSELHSVTVQKGTETPTYDLPKDSAKWDYTEWTSATEGNVTTYTAQRVAVQGIVWTDVDGTVLYTAYIHPGNDIPERYLPNDTAEWHYTNWKRADSDDGSIKFVAERVKKEKIIYLDVDGTLLYTDSKAPDSPLELRALPKGGGKWIYSEWEEITENGGDRTFRAVGTLDPDYFKGNVFQIVVYDINGDALQTGTGFIFNKNGWFVTNHHVLEGGITAKAFFEIENYSEGMSYTVLDIDKGYYGSADKDIFIGRISGYSKISNKYKNIPMVKDYAVGDVTYSVGYPKSSVKMEIHKGEVVPEHDEDFNNLYEKLYSGVTYIPSTSYIYPGSSGGILVNENLEVIGMTSRVLLDKKENFVVGASIRVFNYLSIANAVNTWGEKPMLEVLYPEEGAAIHLFLKAGEHEKCTGLKKDEDGYYYQLIWENTHRNYEEAWVLRVYLSGIIAGNLTRMYVDEPDIMTSTLSGVYKGASSIDDFVYVYTYNWESGGSMTVASSNINYSSDASKTLSKCQSNADGVKISASNMAHARERFNETYVWLRDTLKGLSA